MRTLKTFIILSIFFYSSVGFSQSDDDTLITPTSKGNFVIGGSSNFNFSSSDERIRRVGGTQDNEINRTRFSFMPTVGYFVIDNLAVGGGVSFTSGKTKSDKLDFESTNTSIIFSAFSRYYFTEGNIKPFLQGSVGIGFLNSKGEVDAMSNESKSSVFNYGFNGGVAFFIGKNASLDLGVGFISSSVRPEENNGNHFRVINKGIGIDVGFHIFF